MIIITSHTDNKFIIKNDTNIQEFGLTEPRGIDINDNMMAISHKEKISVYNINDLNLLKNYDSSNHIHEISLQSDKSVIACDPNINGLTKYSESNNELFFTINENLNSSPIPMSWISGMAVDNLRNPTHISVLGISDSIDTSWRVNAFNSKGKIIDVLTNQPIIENLFFPHSPRNINNNLYFINSGKGELCVYNGNGYDVIAKLDGWMRGICEIDSHTIAIGVSGRRHTAIEHIQIVDVETSGVAIVDTDTWTQKDFIPLDVDEIFDVRYVP
jgi:hypothetical protein